MVIRRRIGRQYSRRRIARRGRITIGRQLAITKNQAVGKLASEIPTIVFTEWHKSDRWSEYFTSRESVTTRGGHDR